MRNSSLLAPLREAWGMSGAEAGFIGGVFFAGYMAAVPLLSALTDRIDARRVYFFSNLLAVAGTLGFGLFARGVASGALFQAIAGAGVRPGQRVWFLRRAAVPLAQPLGGSGKQLGLPLPQ